MEQQISEKAAQQADRWRYQLNDLSRPLTVETSYALWGDMLDSNPHLRDIGVEFVAHFPEDNGTVCRFSICDHSATHVDAPIHTVRDAPTLEQMDITRLLGDAIVLDMERGDMDHGYTAEEFEAAGADVEPGDIVLIYSGYVDATRTERIRQQHVTLDGARWLVDRGVRAVGCEPVGIEHLYDGYNVHGYYDPSHPNPWPVHGMLLANDVYIIEGLTNLDKIKGQRVRFSALPLLFPSLSGSPVRAVAWVDE
jgi:kynurenine formamidase